MLSLFVKIINAHHNTSRDNRTNKEGNGIKDAVNISPFCPLWTSCFDDGKLDPAESDILIRFGERLSCLPAFLEASVFLVLPIYGGFSKLWGFFLLSLNTILDLRHDEILSI